MSKKLRKPGYFARRRARAAVLPQADALVIERLEPRVLMSATLGLDTAMTTGQKNQALVASVTPAAAPAVLPAVQTNAASLNAAAVTPTETWTGGAQGKWDDAANWSGDAVPDATTDVTINGQVAVTLGNNDHANGLTLAGGVTLSGGALSTAGAGTSDGSNLNAVGLSLGAPLTLSGSNTLSASTVSANGGALINTGTLVFNGTQAQSINGNIDNAGVISLASGNLGFTGGTLTSEAGAQVTVAAGATLDLDEGGGETYGGTFAASGAGTITLASGVVAADPTNGLTLDISGPQFQWSGGVLEGVNTTSFANIGTITLSGSGEEDLGGTLDNSGVIKDAGNLALTYRTYSANYYGTIDNGGTFAFTADGGIFGGGYVLNSGLFAKTAGSGTSALSSGAGIGFDNEGGSIEVDSGTLELTFGNEAGGAITTATDATLLLNGPYENSFIFSGTFTGSGAGTVALDNDGIGIDPAGATFDFAPGQLQWIDGRLITNSAVLRNTGNITFSNATPGSSAVELSGSIDNFGTITVAGAAASNTVNVGIATVTNETGATIALQNGGGFGGGFTIDNSGLLEMLAGTLSSIAITALNLLPAGTVAVDAGILLLASGGTETGQDFQVASGATLELSGATYAGTLTSTGSGVVALTGGTIAAGGATLDFAPGVASWTTGSFDTRLGGLTNAGALTLSGSDSKTIFGGIFANSGTIMQSGGGLQLSYYYGGTLDNSGAYVITDDSGISGGQVIVNTGTLLKIGGTGTTDINALVDNSGTFGAASGAMTVDDGINATGGIIESLAGGMTIYGGINATGGTIASLAGTLTLAGGTISNTVFDTTTNAASGAQSVITFTGDVTFGGLESGVGTGLVILGQGRNYQAASSGGTLDFATGELQFQGGDLSGGSSSLVNAGELTVNQQITESQLNGLLINTGTFAIAEVSAFDLQPGATITNEAGAVIDFQGDGAFFNAGLAGYGLLLNAGTIRKSAGDLSTIEIGTLDMTGAGAFALDAGTIALDIGTLTGTLASTGTATLALVGAASGLFTNINTLSVAGAALSELGGTLDNLGTIIQLGGVLALDGDRGSQGGVVNNQGVYDLEDDGSIYNNFVDGGLFNNTGLLRISNGTGTSEINTDRSSNSGTVDVSSGTLATNFFSDLPQFSGGTLTGGTWTVESGATLSFNAALTDNAATIALDGAGATVAGLSTLTANSGTLSVSNGASLSLPGTLTNSGLLLAGPSGAISIDGDLDETATGTIETVLDGRPASHAFGTIAITGDVSLAGTLAVGLGTGFAATGGDSYIPVTYAATSGSFSSEVLPAGIEASVQPGDIILNALASGPDLALGTVSVQNAAAAPGQPVSVQFTVTNNGSETATGGWTDSVYLSANGALDANAVLLGRVAHTADLAPGASYTASLTAALPPLADGAYQIVVLADSRDQVADSNRADNLGVSATTVAAATPSLTLGTPVSGNLAGGQDLYYEINVQPGANISIAGTFANADVGQIFVGDGSLPTPSSFDQTASPTTGTQGITVTGAASGTIYVLVHSLASTDAATAFSLLATTTPLSITGLTSTSGTNDQTNFVLGLTGTQFTSSTTVSLVAADGTAYAAKSSDTLFQTAIAATFDLTAIPGGTYTVVAKDGNAVASAATQYTVVPLAYSTDVTALQVTINSPGDVVVGGGAVVVTPIPVTVQFYNPTNTPVLISNFDLYGDNATFPKLPEISYGLDPLLPSDALEIAALITPSTPLLVPANGTNGLSVEADPNPDQPNVLVNFSGQFTNVTSGPLDLASLSAAIKPAPVAQDAWDAVFQNLTAAIGTTTTSLATLEQNDETVLQLVTGASTPPSDADAINLEVLKADDALPTPVLDTATDVDYPEPGLSLTFSRTFESSIVGRYTDGPLGHGWVDNWQYSVSIDPSSNIVTIQQGAVSSGFQANGDGTFTAIANDEGTLTDIDGAFQLTQQDGSVTRFNPDGSLAYVQDANGNRITAGYTNGELISLTAANGEALTIAYNANGTIASVTDPSGRIASYIYDSTGQTLTSVTTTSGTSTYSYGADTSGPTAYELTSITDPGDTGVAFSYDDQGRLTKELVDGNQATTISYGPDSYQVTDADGNTTTAYLDENGNVVVGIDALGYATTKSLNGLGQVTSLGEIGGGASTVSYGATATGTTTTDTDPSGATTSFSASGNGSLTSVTDQDGNVTGYAYDSQGNLVSATYADGSTATYSYAPDGIVTQTVSRSGNVTTYTYDSRGLMLSQTASDGTTTTYTYDSHGNRLTATNATGTITMQYDDANQLTKITYPDGRFLAYTYDAGGRKTRTTDQDGFTTNYNYDSDGRLASMTNGSGALIAKYTYDAIGNLVRQDNGNGTYTTETYDALGDVLSIVNYAPDGTINSRFDYTYDTLGRVITMTTLAGTATYGYDSENRLKSAKLPDGTIITYDYDAAGNRTAVVEGGITTSYTANDLNEYATVGGKAQLYDAAGDLTSDGNGDTYTYDALGRLASVTNASGTWTYQYDALGNRSSETYNGVTTEFLIDPTGIGNIVAEYDSNGNLIANYTYGNVLTSRVTSTGSEYYDFDAQGSTAGLSGASGTYVASYTYDPSGNVLTSTGTVANPFQYGGAYEVQTNGSGLYNMGARSYDPKTGRFTQADPSGLQGGINLYAYAYNNPVTFSDPTGLGGPYIFIPYNPVVDPFADTLLGIQKLDEFASALAYNAATNGPTPPAEVIELVNESATHLLNEAAGYDVYQSFVANAEAAAEIVPDRIIVLSEIVPDPIIIINEAVVVAEQNPAADAAGLGFLATLASSLGNIGPFLVANPFSVIFVAIGIGGAIGSYLYDREVKENTRLSRVGNSTTRLLAGPADPNLIAGPDGYGDANYITGSSTDPYYLAFTNEPTADAPARTVTITQKLDPNLDLSTFQLGAFGFGNTVIAIPAGLQDYTTRIDDRAEAGVYVDVSIQLDVATRTLTATYTSIDPATLDDEANVLVGFLPPDTAPPMGTGWLSYSVSPSAGLASGTTITAQASVVFDTNAPVITNAYVNTIDNDPPTSQVTALPPVVASPAIALIWSGSDGAGSGIASYDIYVSDDGGAYTAFLQNTTETTATFTGVAGHTYSFYSTATDNVGFTELPPATPDATTRVDVAPIAANVTGAVLNDGPAITLTAAYTDPDTNDTHSFTINTTGTQGKVTNNGDGTFTYNPSNAFASLTLGQTATDSFTYTVTDAEGLSSTAVATITVTGIDTAPVAANITGSVSSTGAAITLKAAYTDPDTGDSHSFTINTTNTKGTVTNNGDGTFTYNPSNAFASLTLGQTATDSFGYTVTDAEGLSSTAVATITVTGVDTAPVAANITGAVSSAGAAITLKAAYTDPDIGDSHSFTVNTANTKGTVTNNGDGTFTYNPNGAFASLTLGQTATDSFGYTVTDAEGLSSTAVATITVTGVDTAPVAANITGSVSSTGAAITLKAAYTDPDVGDSHSFTINTTNTKGIVTNNGDGTFTYNPNGAFASLTLGQTATDSFSYTVTDGEGLSSTAVATITVTGIDTAPVAANITGSVSSTGAAITLKAAYTDPDIGDSHSFTINTTNTKGTVTNNGDGTFTYNPNGAFASLTLGQTATDSFSYTVTDGEGLSSTAVATITVTGIDTAPVAANITGSVSSTGAAITLKAAYTDPDIGDSHSFTINTTNTKGTVTNNGDGTFTYNPNGAFADLTLGQTATDSFTYTVTDGEGLSSTAVATITVTGIDTAPVAANITGSVSSTGAAIALKAAYTDPDTGDSHSFTINTTNTKGTVTNNGDGTFTYNPSNAFASLTLGQTATDSFGYTVTDAEGLSSTAVATITVTGVDTAPVAANITGSVSSTGAAITLKAAYTDPDTGDSHSFTINTTNTKGTVTNNGDGTFTYNPSNAFVSLTLGQTATDSFGYTVTDAEGLSSTAVATITVTGIDTAPVAANITGAVSSAGAAITLKAAYTDPDIGDSHSFTVNTANTKGTVTNNGDGTFTYNPNGAFASLTLGQTATDSFGYTVTDGEGLSSTAVATITVTGIDTAPVAANITGAVSSAGAAITLKAAYTDPDIGDSHSFTVNTANTKGTVTNNGDGTFTYNPSNAFASLTLGQTATDSFGYTVTDAEGLSSTAVATITVTGVDTAPVAANITGSVSSTGAAITLKAAYTDPDTGDSHSFTINTTNTKGTVTNNGDGTFTYNPSNAFASLTLGQTATDSFGYTVTDAEGLSSTAVATITVTGVDTAPVAANITGAVSSAGAAITLKAAYTDPDTGDSHSFTINTTNTKGTVTNDGDGTFTYNPSNAFASLTLGQTATDSFTYTVTDAEGLSSTAVATITVTGGEAAPVADNITGSALSDGPAITLNALYTDPVTGDTPSFTIDTTNTQGQVINNGDGTFTYNPNGAFATLARNQTTTDSFTYTVTDGEGLSATAVATITITGVGTAPVANPDGPYTTTIDTPLIVDANAGLLANDTGPEHEKLRAELVQPPSDGTLVLNKDGSFSYTANTGYVGTDSFTYDAVDASGASAPATVSIDVQNTLTLRVAADDFEGGASFTVAVDGVQIGGVQTVSSAFGAGQYTDITLNGDFAATPKQVSVTFINDLYEGTPQTDRNLYVESLSIDGNVFLGAAATNPVGPNIGGATVLASDGTATFDVQPASLQTLTLRVAADTFMGGAQFTVAVDGVQLGGTLLASSAFGAGQFQDITFVGNFGPDPKQVSVTFLNDLYEGTPQTDRNLYVESLTIDGHVFLGAAATNPVGMNIGGATLLASDGTATFNVQPAKLQTLTLRVAADLFMGGAEFTVAVDGVQLGGTLQATTAFDSGQVQDITFVGDFGPNPQQVSVSFLNDLYEGTPLTDRNLYVESLTFAGQTIPGSAATNPAGTTVGFSAELLTNGTITLALPPLNGPASPPASGAPDILILPALRARDFILEGTDPEVPTWVVSLLSGLTLPDPAGTNRNGVVVDLNANTGTAA